AEAIGQIRRLRTEHGRADTPFEFSMSPTNANTPDDLKRYRDAGVDELYLTPVFQQAPNTEAEVVKLLEGQSRSWVETAAKI
ncbi:MAG: hypothetical protein ACREQC_00115, partial [Candidatus Binataceae bacterium]